LALQTEKIMLSHTAVPKLTQSLKWTEFWKCALQFPLQTGPAPGAARPMQTSNTYSVWLARYPCCMTVRF